MYRQLSYRPTNPPSRKLRHLVAVAVAAAMALPSTAEARTFASSLLQMDMTIPSGAITNKFGFATSFPRPEEAPPIGVKNGNPGGDRRLFTANGGSASIGPNRPEDGIERRNIPKGRGMKLYLEETTNAMPVDGSIGQAEGWLTGTAKFRLGNFTGRPGLPEPPENLTIGLNLSVTHDLFASATNDLIITDRANAKVVYSLVNTTTGAVVVPETVITVDDDDVRPDERNGPLTVNVPIPGVNLPSNSFENYELFGHIYVAGESRGSAPTSPPPPVNRPPGSIPNLPERMDQALPDDKMRLPIATLSLFGDAAGHGGGTLLASAGVVGEDPEARQGLNTVMLGNAVTSGDQFFDIDVAVEVPVNGFSQVALDDAMSAAMGFHGQFYNLQLGTGVGGEFQPSQDPIMLSLAGQQSPLPPEELTGAYQAVGANDPANPSQVMFAGQLQPGQMAQFQYVANLHDAADGVIDGMARFTLRKHVQGFGGDYDQNHATDGGDLALWQQTFGTDDFLADGDASGHIAGGDFMVWQRNVGRGDAFPPLAAAAAVPEPSAIALGLASLGGLALLRRRLGKA